MAKRYLSLQQYSERIKAIEETYHAQNFRVFGSVARSEERSDSDIDLLFLTLK